jgi:chaperonin cofactor prefoldin
MSTKRTTTETAQSAIDGLRKRFDALNTRRIQIQTQLEAEQTRLAELKRDAQSQFGTDDIGNLTEMLQELERANAEKVKAYQASLDSIEQSLSRVESETQAANSERQTSKS